MNIIFNIHDFCFVICVIFSTKNTMLSIADQAQFPHPDAASVRLAAASLPRTSLTALDGIEGDDELGGDGLVRPARHPPHFQFAGG